MRHLMDDVVEDVTDAVRSMMLKDSQKDLEKVLKLYMEGPLVSLSLEENREATLISHSAVCIVALERLRRARMPG